MAYQVFIDDSGTKGTGVLLMLGGLFGTAEAMAIVADQWDRELRAHIPLPVRYFKAYEARSLSGEFADWRPEGRDQKVRRLASIVDRDDLLIMNLLTSKWVEARHVESQHGVEEEADAAQCLRSRDTASR